MVCYTIAATCCIAVNTPSYNGENMLFAPMENIVLYGLVALSVVYNYFFLSKVYRLSDLFKFFDISIWLILLVGFLQLGGMRGIGPCISIYDVLCNYLALKDMLSLISMDRGVVCFGSEPSSMMIYFLLLVPYLIAVIRYQKKRKMMHIAMLLLLAILMIGSNSSSVMIAMGLTCICVVMWILNGKYPKWMLYSAFCIGAAVAILYAIDFTVNTSNRDSESFEYVIYGKVVDHKNMSTAMRSSTVASNINILIKYPFTGVGMGTQGLWYDETIPSWTRHSEEVQAVLRGRHGIGNGGGNFFPVWMSSFGIPGIILLMLFVARYRKWFAESAVMQNEITNAMVLIGWTISILSLWYVLGFKLFETQIVLFTLPLIKAKGTMPQ
jgi:hypothetical protein